MSYASGTILCVRASSFRMWQFSGLMNCAFMVMRRARRRGQFRHLTRRAERRCCEIDAWFMAPAVDAVAHSLEILLPLARIMQICVWRGTKIIGANSERYAKQDYQIFNIPFLSGTPGEWCWKWIMLLLLSISMRTWHLIRSLSRCQLNCFVFMGLKHVDRINIATRYFIFIS